ncbi:drug/metabolite transporter (DMT)-like permease [Parvibaculum indicum]|uniref:DMT family transporter n=1 Tax=Parvibaculum indicum TaxID=562969 RepID=UPI00141EB2CC|nr:DMT family transporter [Parvibaculum indicum]NIJ40451.1 drug/metabolite transporter (DMT)-like permease [Parvibaculum indicum]
MTSRPLSHWILLALLVFCWGSAFAFTKLALRGMTPEWVMALRLGFGGLLLLALLLFSNNRLTARWRDWRWFVALGLVGNILPFFAISWGQQQVPSALAGILIGFVPLATLALAHFFVPEERITLPRFAGFSIGFAGLVIVIGPGALTSLAGDGAILMGELAVLAGAFCFACNNVLARRAPDMPIIAKSTGVLTAGAVAGLLVASTVTPPARLMEAGAVPLLSAAGLGFLSTGLAALVFFRIVDRAGATFVALSNYLVPAFAALAGYALFDEELTLRTLIGLALILVGIAVSEWRRRRA